MSINSELLYNEINETYQYFNHHLFQDVLPGCAITLTRHNKAYGYFAPDAWQGRGGGETASEIALNPDHFISRDPAQIYSTLVHEMCHQYQHIFGKPSRTGYHNKEFAAIMASVGLVVTDTGLPGGKQTGQRMSHYIAEGGLFETLIAKWQETHISDWGSIPITANERSGTPSKVKFTCPECEQNAWAKPGARLYCGCEHADMELIEMLSAVLLDSDMENLAECPHCEGLGYEWINDAMAADAHTSVKRCELCDGDGYITLEEYQRWLDDQDRWGLRGSGW